MIFDYKEDTNKYVVHSKKDGNEIVLSFSTISEVADYAEKNKDITVWYVMSCKLPEGVYARKK